MPGGGFGGGSVISQLKMRCGPTGNAAMMTGADKCKDLIILEAIYDKNGNPLYRWVPPMNAMDPTSIPDNLKDHIMNVLIQKVQSQPGRQATNKQMNLMRALGDPPNYAKPMFGISVW